MHLHNCIKNTVNTTKSNLKVDLSYYFMACRLQMTKHTLGRNAEKLNSVIRHLLNRSRYKNTSTFLLCV